MDFHQLEYVIAIAEEKSISKAAKKLYISQPSLSQYIIRLEDNLGIKLFERKGNFVTLTYAGEKYLTTAKNILNLNEQLQKELSDIAGSKKGRLTIGIPNQTGRYVLPLVLPEFHKQFPQVEIEVKEDVTTRLEEMLINHRTDIAILNLPIQQKEILYEPISTERVFLVAPKDHKICSEAEIKGYDINFSSLKNEKFILLKREQRMRFIADKIFEKAHFKPDILLELKNLDTAHRIAASGMGFTFIPENVIWLFNTNKYNNYFLIDDTTINIAIAYREGEYLNESTRKFIDIAKKAMELNHKERTENNINYNKIYVTNE